MSIPMDQDNIPKDMDPTAIPMILLVPPHLCAINKPLIPPTKGMTNKGIWKYRPNGWAR